jgi:hypothetical protein
VVARNFMPGPDLVVERLIVTSDAVTVVVKNQGSVPVATDEEFWVDVYVAPDPAPTGVNQRWENLGSQGLCWGVTASALPLAPGDVITLTIGDAYYWPSFSNFAGSLAEGTLVYAQVDSMDACTTYGAVLENHEIAGSTYNNISSAVSTLGFVGEKPPVIQDGWSTSLGHPTTVP